MKRLFFAGFLSLILGFLLSNAFAQHLKPLSASEILLELKKMQVLGSVLYVAAHPDDENTALLAYYANEKLVKTTYLSLTRGDGGQNLIGAEQDELLGLIRTQELLQARRIDGATQTFTRADDFGFSKSYQETFKIWDKNAILADVVWAIRKYRPDVIINRFPPNENAGHGHHAASAVLSIEAFNLAANPAAFPEQLQYVKVWQAKRIVWNSFNPNFTNTAPQKGSASYTEIDLGTYNTLLGKSYTEIAGESRSMHKSQGFGSARRRGERVDYLLHIAGEPAKKDVLEDIDLSWGRLKGGNNVATILQIAQDCFKPENPTEIVPYLVQAYKEMQKLSGDTNDNFWITTKQQDLQNLIAGCLGLWFEANAKDYTTAWGDSLEINAQIIKRSEYPAKLQSIVNQDNQKRYELNFNLTKNKLVEQKIALSLSPTSNLTQPYWLEAPTQNGAFQVKKQQLIGLAENSPVASVSFAVIINEVTFQFIAPINYKWVAPETGELYRNLALIPPVMVNIPEKALVFANAQPKTVSVRLKAGKNNQKGVLMIENTGNWQITPSQIPFALTKKDEELTVSFQIIPPKQDQTSALSIKIKTTEMAQAEPAKGILSINYPHIPIQTLFPEAQISLTKLAIKTSQAKIGYLEGAGDKVSDCIAQMGYQVVKLKDEDFIQNKLADYQAIVLGIRAFNTVERIKFYEGSLNQYIKNGGILLIQYNTNRGLLTENLAPYSFKIGRERVTEEDAVVNFLEPNHPLLNYPNKITQQDFEGWVQERGLYFAEVWDNNFTPLLAMNDTNETAKKGGLLVANFGKGRVIYTGLSFFRQLPAGVKGAYRLLVNLIEKNK